MRWSICNELFEGWDFPRVARFVAALGYDAVELAPYTIAETVDEVSGTQRKEIRAMAADAGIGIAGLHWLLVKPEGLHLSHPDSAIRLRTVDYLRKLIDLCGDLGGEVMVFGSPKQRSALPGIERTDAWRWAVEGFSRLAEPAAARGVTICLEPLPPDLTNLLNTAAETVSMVSEISHPNIRMMLDVKSMCAEKTPIPEIIQACRGYYRHFHANDANLRGPGFGDTDFRPILSTLAAEGYDGYVSVEVFDFAPDPETIAARSLSYLMECSGSR